MRRSCHGPRSSPPNWASTRRLMPFKTWWAASGLQRTPRWRLSIPWTRIRLRFLLFQTLRSMRFHPLSSLCDGSPSLAFTIPSKIQSAMWHWGRFLARLESISPSLRSLSSSLDLSWPVYPSRMVCTEASSEYVSIALLLHVSRFLTKSSVGHTSFIITGQAMGEVCRGPVPA